MVKRKKGELEVQNIYCPEKKSSDKLRKKIFPEFSKGRVVLTLISFKGEN